jgi:hypothetical protein
MATANELLAAAVKAAAEATAKVEELEKQSRDADLQPRLTTRARPGLLELDGLEAGIGQLVAA